MIKEVKKYALGLEYIGTNLKGWQRQKKGHTTVQDIVEKSLSKFLDQKISTICSGRTDSGVRALNQTVHFETSKSRTDESFLKGLNSLMGPQVKAIWIKKVDKDCDYYQDGSLLTPKNLLDHVDYSLRNDPDILAIINKKK